MNITSSCGAYEGQDVKARLNNPVWHIHGGDVPTSNMVVPFSMLLNLAAVSGAEEKDQLWGFIQRYAPEASAATHPDLDQAAGFAVRYYNDLCKTNQSVPCCDGPRARSAGRPACAFGCMGRRA